MWASIIESVVLYLVAAVVPAIFFALWIVFRWRFLRALKQKMYDDSGGNRRRRIQTETSAGTVPVEALLSAAPRQLNQDCLQAAKRAAAMRRRVFVIAGILHMALAFGVITFTWSSRWMGAIGVGYYHLAPQMVVLLILLRARWRSFGVAAICWIMGFVALFVAAGRTPSAAVPAAFDAMIEGSLVVVAPTILVGILALRSLSTLMTSLAALGLVAIGPAPFAIAGLEAVDATSTDISTRAIVLSALSLAIGVTAAGWSLRRGISRYVVWAFVALAGVAAAGFFAPDPIDLWLAAIGGIGVNGLCLLLCAALLRRFAWLKTRGWLPDDVLQSVFCWGVFAIWSAEIIRGPAWWALLPWSGYMVALFAGLYVTMPHVSENARVRLVLLRVFGRSRRQRRLMNALDSTWRHVGRIDLPAGLDLALPTLSALALQDFLLSKIDRLFIADAAEAERRLATLSSQRAIDGRYPVNEVYCAGKAWQQIVELLLVDVTCVLIDLRGFTLQNEGAAYEFAVVVTRVPLDSLVVLVDKQTDCAAIGALATRAWKSASQAASRDQPLRLLFCTGPEPKDTESIVSEVFSTLAA
jgi:hypothetical protein